MEPESDLPSLYAIVHYQQPIHVYNFLITREGLKETGQ